MPRDFTRQVEEINLQNVFYKEKNICIFSQRTRKVRLNSKRSVEEIPSEQVRGGRRNRDGRSKESPKATGAESGSWVGRSLRSPAAMATLSKEGD